MRELKKNINEGTEMGEIGNVQIDLVLRPKRWFNGTTNSY